MGSNSAGGGHGCLSRVRAMYREAEVSATG